MNMTHSPREMIEKNVQARSAGEIEALAQLVDDVNHKHYRLQERLEEICCRVLGEGVPEKSAAELDPGNGRLGDLKSAVLRAIEGANLLSAYVDRLDRL